MIDYFYNNQFTLLNMIDNLCLFIFYDLKYFKKSDLQVIHKNIGISKTSYHLFTKILDEEMRKMCIQEHFIS
jgi:hypothetical protein